MFSFLVGIKAHRNGYLSPPSASIDVTSILLPVMRILCNHRESLFIYLESKQKLCTVTSKFSSVRSFLNPIEINTCVPIQAIFFITTILKFHYLACSLRFRKIIPRPSISIKILQKIKIYWEDMS